MRYLRTNTATRITVGPFLDKSDGITPEVAQTVTSMKLTFVVDTAGVPTLVLDVAPTASGGNNDMVHITADDSGFYDLELTAADTNYLGRAMLSLNNVAEFCPVFHEFMILPAMIYDSMILGTDRLDTNVTHVGDTAQTAGDIMADTNDIQARLPAALVSGRMDSSVGAMAANVLTAAAINADAFTAAKFAADVTTEIQTGLATAAELAKVPKSDGTVAWNATAAAQLQSEANDALVAYDPPTGAELVSEINAVQADIAALNNPSAAGIADAVWDEDATGHQTQGTFGQAIGDPVADTNTLFKAVVTDAAGATVGVDVVAVKAETAAIVADTNELQSDWANAGRLDNILDARSSQTSVDDLPTNAELATALGTADDAVLTAIDALPTNAELATALAGADDATLAAIAALNNPSAATIADAVWDEDATAHQTQGSFGQAIGDPGADADTIWALANTNLNATVGSRASQTSVDDLPTNAELTTALGTADDATLAAIAALNNLSEANVRTAIGLATANLDTQLDALPTNSELAAALATADDATLAAVAALNNLSSAQAQTAAAAALTAYDPPTRAEATSDKAEIITEVNANETKIDTVDTVVDAIKVTTDKFVFTVANVVDSNIQRVNDVVVTGTGAVGDEWGP